MLNQNYKMMKKILLLSLVSVCSFFVSAQSEGPELGVRLGGGYGTGFSAVDFVLPVSDMNRIHLDLGIGNRYFGLEGLYEWQFDIGENFSVYPGFGLGYYSWSHHRYDKHRHIDERYRYSTIAVLGVIGIEYQIQPVPLTVGIDFRPAFGLNNDVGYGSVGGLMCRYRF